MEAGDRGTAREEPGSPTPSSYLPAELELTALDEVIADALLGVLAVMERMRPKVAFAGVELLTPDGTMLHVDDSQYATDVAVAFHHLDEPRLFFVVRVTGYHDWTQLILQVAWDRERPLNFAAGVAAHPRGTAVELGSGWVLRLGDSERDEVTYHWEKALERLEWFFSETFELRLDLVGRRVADIRLVKPRQDPDQPEEVVSRRRERRAALRRKLLLLRLFSRWHREERHRVSFTANEGA